MSNQNTACSKKASVCVKTEVAAGLVNACRCRQLEAIAYRMRAGARYDTRVPTCCCVLFSSSKCRNVCQWNKPRKASSAHTHEHCHGGCGGDADIDVLVHFIEGGSKHCRDTKPGHKATKAKKCQLDPCSPGCSDTCVAVGCTRASALALLLRLREGLLSEDALFHESKFEDIADHVRNACTSLLCVQLSVCFLESWIRVCVRARTHLCVLLLVPRMMKLRHSRAS